MKALLLQNMLYVPTRGGANKVSRCLMEGLGEKGYTVRVVAPALGNHGALTQKEFFALLSDRGIKPVFQDEDVCILNINGVEIHAVFDSTKLHLYASAQLRKFVPDWVIVSSQDPGQSLLRTAVSFPGVSVVYFVQAVWDLPFGPAAIFESPETTALVKNTSILTVSSYLQEYIKRWEGLESTVIYAPAYGTGPFPNFGNKRNGYVTLINPSAIKGLSIFTDLAARLPHVPFAAVPTWATTSADRTRLSSISNVRLLPASDHIDEIFEQTKILLMPSLLPEAFGLLAVEAMLRGIPVLSSNAGGLVEAKLGADYVLTVAPIEKYQQTFDDQNYPIPLIPPQNITIWEDALTALLNDELHYQQLSTISRQKALAFVASLGIDPYHQFLQQIAIHKKTTSDIVTGKQTSSFEARSASRNAIDKLSMQEKSSMALRALKLKKAKNNSAETNFQE